MAQCNNGKESPWKSSCSPRMMKICPPYLEKDSTFTFLQGRVKRILITVFKGEIEGWEQCDAKGSEF